MTALRTYIDYRAEEWQIESSSALIDAYTAANKDEADKEVAKRELLFDVYSYKKNGMRTIIDNFEDRYAK